MRLDAPCPVIGETGLLDVFMGVLDTTTLPPGRPRGRCAPLASDETAVARPERERAVNTREAVRWL